MIKMVGFVLYSAASLIHIEKGINFRLIILSRVSDLEEQYFETFLFRIHNVYSFLITYYIHRMKHTKLILTSCLFSTGLHCYRDYNLGFILPSR